jgi:NAD-reducing hydrogenase large subunit
MTMSRTIVIDPVTRLEGHAKITLKTNSAGGVEEAYFHVTQVRGFEKFCEGRPFYEMPSLMARICGICPVSHLIASAKACEAIQAVVIPPTAAKLRQLLNLAQMVQSHALSFFYLSSPDLLLGMDSDQADRNIFGVVKSMPEVGRAGIQLRRFGQRIIEILGKKRIHPGWVVPGGVTEPLTIPRRDEILAMIPESCASILLALDAYKQIANRFQEEASVFANFPSMFLGLVTPDGGLEFTDGALRLNDATGDVVADGMEASSFDQEFGEAVEPFTFMKFPYYRKLGYPDGCYRVGPLARMNLVDHTGTPRADAELREFKALANGPVLESFYYHQARLIEILYGIEAIEHILADADILDTHVRATAGVNSLEGSGVAEAPRGTLMHHYKVDENGQMLWANLVIATGQNNKAMNRGILQVAQHYVDGNRLTDGMLNRVEAVIRAFDPCLSCSTHAFGEMPLVVELVDPDGRHLDDRRRNG